MRPEDKILTGMVQVGLLPVFNGLEFHLVSEGFIS
jgi:hypothetical protein